MLCCHWRAGSDDYKVQLPLAPSLTAAWAAARAHSSDAASAVTAVASAAAAGARRSLQRARPALPAAVRRLGVHTRHLLGCEPDAAADDATFATVDSGVALKDDAALVKQGRGLEPRLGPDRCEFIYRGGNRAKSVTRP